MKAARYYGREDVRIEHNVPLAPLGEGQVRIKPAFVGICGSDLHEFTGGPKQALTIRLWFSRLTNPSFMPAKPHPLTKESLPVTMGHEFSGTIKEVGPGVNGLQQGIKVAIQPTIYCGCCPACDIGAENACPSGGFIGLSGGGGGLSEDVVVPALACVPLPEQIGLDLGALVEPLSVAWHAVDAAAIAEQSGAKCLVLGGGPIGLAVVQILLARGTGKIIVSEVASKRQAFAKEFGAHHVLDPTKEDIKLATQKLCGGQGADIVFDCAGVPASLQIACTAVRSRGTVINVAIWEKPVPFNPMWLVLREAKYLGVIGYQLKDFQAVVEAIGDGRLKPANMITSRIQLDNVVEDGIRALIRDKDQHVKILVDMEAA